MIDLGSDLRQAREVKGISLDEAEAATRIKQRYLQALESNDWAALPTPVQARGFLRNYAIYLGLDDDQVMSRYGQIMHSAGARFPPSPTPEAAVRTTGVDGAVFEPRNIDIEGVGGRLPDWLSLEVILGVVLALVVALGVYGVSRLVVGNSDQATAPLTMTPSILPAVTDSAPLPTTDAGELPAEEMTTSATPTFDASFGGVQLTLEAIEHVWVRVTVDGATVIEGILTPGPPQTWQGTQQIVLMTANGAGLKAVVNGQPLEALGERGQNVVLAWGPSGPMPPPPTTVP